jgi:Ni/Co efflux regulator RcnB
MRFVALLLASCIGAGAMAAPPPWANSDKDDKPKPERKAKEAVDDRADPNAKNPEVGKGTHMGKQPLKPGAYLNDNARSSVREYYAQRKDCPPGLARKNNGCMPPGQAKKWQIGQPVPRGSGVAPVPQEVLVLLPKAPPGHQYIAYSGDILLIAATSRMVVDGITISVTVR